MNIEEARKVLWLKSNPRPLGELLDEGDLTQDRLEWASQWAFNYKLKEAAQVLLEVIKILFQRWKKNQNLNENRPLRSLCPLVLLWRKHALRSGLFLHTKGNRWADL